MLQAVEGSGFAAKIERLYAKERIMYFGHGRQIATTQDFDETSFVMEERSEEEWLDIAFERENYGDDMECG